MSDITPPSSSFISLSGAPRQVGEAQGRMYLPFREEALRQLTPKREVVFPIADLHRAEWERTYIRLVEKWAPHWLPECEGMAAALDIPIEEYLYLNSIRSITRWESSLSEDCTSWVVFPDAAADGRMMLHKNRDGGSAWQGWLSKRIDGTKKWMGMVDLLGIGVLSGVNEAGFAVIVNCGEPCAENNRFGLCTPNILRILLERAGSAAEAVDLCLEIIQAGEYAHGEKGSIFMMADARRAFVIENTACRGVSVEIPGGFEVRSNDWLLPGLKALGTGLPEKRRISALTRRERAVAFLRERRLAGGITVQDSRALSKDRVNAGDPMKGSPIANDRTSFGVTMLLDPDRPDMLTEMSVLLGPPPTSCAVSLAFGVSGTPALLADSRLTQRAFALRDERGMEGDHVPALTEAERGLDDQFSAVVSDAGAALRNGDRDGAVRALDQSLWAAADAAFSAIPIREESQSAAQD